MIEDEIKALRCAIEEHTNQYVKATQAFAVAVNHLSEKIDTLGIEKHGTDTPPPAEDKPEPKPAKKKKAAKKKAKKKKVEKKAEPKPADELKMLDVKAKLTKVVQYGGMNEMTSKMADVLGQGVALSEVEDGDPKLLELDAFANQYLAEKG